MIKGISIFLLLSCLSLSVYSQENTPIRCGDGIDNDGDGLVDCADPDCANLPNEGCTQCSDGISFADVLIAYNPGCTTVDPNPIGAVGVSDWTGSNAEVPEVVFLGQGGSIRLGFSNNVLTNSGSAIADLWIFEAGSAAEACDVELRPANSFTASQLQNVGISDLDADGYYDFGSIQGATSSVDIDAIIPGYASGELLFDAVEVTDVVDGNCTGHTPGADIDAVCALSYVILPDCAGTPNGLAVIDDCGNCLERFDPNFNACVDCAGTPNGTAVIDECGRCFDDSTDPNFNACFDCAGTPNGAAVFDDCGICLEPSDPDFNACVDCAGTVNGTAIFDDCGLCLEPTELAFNLTCLRDIYIPTAFSPNSDGVNDKFQLFKKQETIAIVSTYMVFSRWGELIYQANNFEFSDIDKWWDGRVKGDKDVRPGTYVFYIEVKFSDNIADSFVGDITVLE